MSNKKLSFPHLNNLTIVILTYQRQKYILRAMNYWSGSNVKLVVIDGSKLGIEDRLIKKLSNNINYIHHPVSLHQRMLYALKFVETEFVLLGGDDDFFIPSALNSCIEILLKDKELVSCIGRSMKFNFKNNQTIGRPVYQLLKDHKLVDENPMSRIKKHFLNFIPAHCYSICRTNFWKIAMAEAFYKEYNFFASGEKQFEFLITFSNKSISIPELMWLRSDENIPIRGTSPAMSNDYKLVDWWYDEKYKNEKQEFIYRTELACQKISEINKKDYKPDVIAGIEAYINFYKNDYSKLFKNNFFSYPLNLLHLIFKKFPKFFTKPVKIVFKYFGFKPLQSNELPFFDQLKFLEQEGVKIDYDELNVIEKNIKSFYLNNQTIDKK